MKCADALLSDVHRAPSPPPHNTPTHADRLLELCRANAPDTVPQRYWMLSMTHCDTRRQNHELENFECHFTGETWEKVVHWLSYAWSPPTPFGWRISTRYRDWNGAAPVKWAPLPLWLVFLEGYLVSPGTLPEHGRTHDRRLQQKPIFFFGLFFFSLLRPKLQKKEKKTQQCVTWVCFKNLLKSKCT